MSNARSAGLVLALLSAATFSTSGPFAGSLIATGWSPGGAVVARLVVAAAALTVPAVLALRGRWSPAASAAPGRSRSTAWSPSRPRSSPTSTRSRTSRSGSRCCWSTRASCSSSSGCGCGTAAAPAGWPSPEPSPPSSVSRSCSTSSVGSGSTGSACSGAWSRRSGSPCTSCSRPTTRSRCRRSRCPAPRSGSAPSCSRPAAWPGCVPLRTSTADVELAGHQVSWLVPVLGLSLVAAALAYVLGIVGARLLGRDAGVVRRAWPRSCSRSVFAWLFVGQVPTPVQAIGGVVVIAGVALVRLGELRAPSVAPVAGAGSAHP